jgi:hypothetical protein
VDSRELCTRESRVKELFSEEEATVGELMEAAKAASPGSIEVEGLVVTYMETITLSASPASSRWCFPCRTVTEHSVVAAVPVGESIDTPLNEIRCLNCGGKDADLFPGKEREDDQPE